MEAIRVLSPLELESEAAEWPKAYAEKQTRIF